MACVDFCVCVFVCSVLIAKGQSAFTVACSLGNQKSPGQWPINTPQRTETWPEFRWSF